MAKEKTGTKKVCTIWLESEVEGTRDKLKMFYCFNCRVPICQYRGAMIQVIPGGTPYEPYSEHKCKGNVRNTYGEWETCGMYYIFASTVFTKNPEIA